MLFGKTMITKKYHILLKNHLINSLTHILFFFSGSVIGLKAEVMGITFYGLGSNVHLFLTWILLARKGYLNPVLSLALGLNILGMAFGKSIFF